MITRLVPILSAAMVLFGAGCVESQHSLPTGIYEDVSLQYRLRVTKDRIEVLSLGKELSGRREAPLETCNYTLRDDGKISIYGMTSNQDLTCFRFDWDGNQIVMNKTVMGKSEFTITLKKMPDR